MFLILLQTQQQSSSLISSDYVSEKESSTALMYGGLVEEIWAFQNLHKNLHFVSGTGLATDGLVSTNGNISMNLNISSE